MKRKTLIIGLLHQPTHPESVKMESLPISEVLKGRQHVRFCLLHFRSEEAFWRRSEMHTDHRGKKKELETNMSRNILAPLLLLIIKLKAVPSLL